MRGKTEKQVFNTVLLCGSISRQEKMLILETEKLVVPLMYGCNSTALINHISYQNLKMS